MQLEWIKITCDLPFKWQVLSIRRVLKLRTVDEVIGKLFRLWSHFENQSQGGRIKNIVPEDIDMICGKKGFAAAVAAVNWLVFDESGASIPAYDEYMGAAARRRDAENKKKRNYRERETGTVEAGQGRDNSGTEPGTSTGQPGGQGGDKPVDGSGTEPGQAGGQVRDKVVDKVGTIEEEKEAEAEGDLDLFKPEDSFAMPPAASAKPATANAGQTGESASKKKISDEYPDPPPDTVLSFPTVGDVKIWHLTKTQLAEWEAAYPQTDLLAECRKALVWINANERKTARGMKAFLVNWINRCVKTGTTRAMPASRPTETLEEKMKRMAKEMNNRPQGGS